MLPLCWQFFYTCIIFGFGSGHTKGSYEGSQWGSDALSLPVSPLARGHAWDPSPASSPPGTGSWDSP